MRKYIVLLNKSAEQVGIEIVKSYPKPDHFEVNKHSYLVRTKDLAHEISEKIGLGDTDEENPATGLVLRLNGAYSGFNSPALWEWLRLEDEDDE